MLVGMWMTREVLTVKRITFDVAPVIRQSGARE